MAVALSAGGGGGGAVMPSAPMAMTPPQPQPFSQVPRMRVAAPGVRAPAAPRGASTDGDESAFGGDACLCVEFAGGRVCAAAWDARKREAVALPVGTEGAMVGADAAVEVDSSKTSQLAAWLSKPPKARAAEVHTSAVRIATSGAGGTRVEAPGLALGAADVEAASARAGDQGWSFREPEREDESSPLLVPGSRVSKDFASIPLTPEDCVALLIARPRQRATQLVAKPVRRLLVVAPAGASQAWRLAALEACGKIDARCTRMVSAPLALALAHRGAGESVLAVDATPVPGTSSMLVDAVVAKVSPHGAAVAAISSEIVEKSAVPAVIEALKKAHEHDAVVARGIRVEGAIAATQMDAVLAAATLRASELGLPGAPQKLVASEALASPLFARILPDGDPDQLFDAHAQIPASIRRVYRRDNDKETVFAFLEGDAKTPCGAGMEDPFETVDDDGEVVLAKAATVEYKVDSRGIMSAQVIHADAPKSKARAAREASQRRCRRVAAAVTAAFFLTPVFYTLIHMRRRAVVRKHTITALEDFYRRAKPDKIHEASFIADKYEGFEELLFKRLERQYPGFTITRPGSSSSSERNSDDEEDVIEL